MKYWQLSMETRHIRIRLGIFLCSLLLTGFQVYHISDPLHHVYSDMRGYIERGWYLASGAPFVQFDAFYPPGTAYLYAIFFKLFGFKLGISLIVATQILFVSCSNVLTGLIAEKLFTSRNLGTALMLGATCYWPFALQASYFTAEPAFSFFMLLGLYHFTLTCVPSAQNNLALSDEQPTPVQAQKTITKLFRTGFIISLAVLLKAQAIVLIAGMLTYLFCEKSFANNRLRFSATLAAGLLFPLLLQCGLNSVILHRPTLQLAQNGAFNAYLGQSRHAAIGCLDRVKGYFYIFHNNNAGLNYPFRDPVILPRSILDDAFFSAKVRALWREAPLRQVLISLENIVELLEINPRWPYDSDRQSVRVDMFFQRLALFFITIPAIVTCLRSLRLRSTRDHILLIVVPVCGMIAMAAVTMGQPRYLLPFMYFLLLLAAPTYLQLALLLKRTSPRKQSQ